jgi:hypothetical protein
MRPYLPTSTDKVNHRQTNNKRQIYVFCQKKQFMTKTKMKAGETTYAIDTQIASIMLIRRDVTIEDWSIRWRENTALKLLRGST